MANGSESTIDLAREESFRIGPLEVDPPLRRVSTGETLEPRVMQVLVVLARANGAVVSRDELIRSCWGGRIVGNDSINRVIQRLRKLALGLGEGAFSIETVPRVGYRLIGEVSSCSPEEEPPPVDSSRLEAETSSRWFRFGLIAAVGLALIGGVTLWAILQPPRTSSAKLMIGAITAQDVARGSAETLRSALLSGVAPERFQVLSGNGSLADYRLTGRLVGSPDGVTLFVTLRRPGFGAPIWTPKIRFANDTSVAAVGDRLISAARCVVEGDREPPARKSSVALAAWASYCDENSKDSYDEDRQIEALRVAVRAEPRFVMAQTALAVFLGEDAQDSGSGRANALRQEGLRAAVAAEKIDPDNASVYLAESFLTRQTDFLGRERLIGRALSVRPTDWGEEFQARMQVLWSVGRLREAYAAAQRSLAINPGNPITTVQAAAILSTMGRYQEARQIFANQVATRMDRSVVDAYWLRAAIDARDLTSARRLASSEPDDQLRAAAGLLIDALGSNSPASKESAGESFERLSRNPALLTPLTVLALAASGRDVEALQADERLFASKGFASPRVIYSAAFDQARRRPEFVGFAERTGLLAYWRNSGHPPDFCLAADAPPICDTLRSRVALPVVGRTGVRATGS